MATTAQAAAHFRATAPKYMRMFMEDFDASDLDAAAVFGNAGYESLGFTKLQEMKPTVKGSRGGWGWFQWTADRRRAFEAYCARNGYDPASDDANYKFLFVELIGSEKGALAKLKAARTLEDKVIAFEAAFERAGVKAYPKRQEWAQIALDALHGSTVAAEPVQRPEPLPRPTIPAEPLPPVSAQQKPSLWPILIVGALAILAGLAAWLFTATPEPAPAAHLLSNGAPFPADRPAQLFGGPGVGSTIAGAIALEIAKAFVMPLISAGVTAVVGWVVYWWQRVLKSRFDQQSADQLHAALERGVVAAVDALGGAFGNKASILSHAANYAETWNGGTVKRFGLTRSDLEALAAPHLAKIKRGL